MDLGDERRREISDDRLFRRWHEKISLAAAASARHTPPRDRDTASPGAYRDSATPRTSSPRARARRVPRALPPGSDPGAHPSRLFSRELDTRDEACVRASEMPAASGGSYGADALEGLGRNSKVWIAVAAPGDDDAADMYRPATVISLGADTAEVRLNDELEVSVPLAEVFPANPDILEGAEDLTQLSYLNEPSILHDLHHRYGVDDIYTRAGPVLIAVNPFKSLPALYAPDVVAAYRAGTAQKPHVYRVASAAYDEMIRHRKNQAVIISGESGAGKTETTKIAMGFLASVGGGGAGVESRVLQTNPILEAFGNAKTLRNDNSSRFGKLIDIGFDRGGVITGASVQAYLLEKSRVTSQSEGERGYHVFYQLCAGATEAERAAFRILPNVTDYAYLSNSSCAKIAGVDDASSYRELKAALLGVGTSEADVRDIFRVVAAVMWLGNVTFVEEAVDGEDNAARVAPGKGAEALEIASDLLGVSSERLESSFVTRKLRAGANQ